MTNWNACGSVRAERAKRDFGVRKRERREKSPCLSAFEERNAKKEKRAKMRENGLKKGLE